MGVGAVGVPSSARDPDSFSDSIDGAGALPRVRQFGIRHGPTDGLSLGDA
jgi:hypothetical protein